MKILLVDDDQVFSHSLCKLLYEANNEVDYCNNMNDAFREISKTQYDVVLIDLMLPPTYTEEGIIILRHIKNIPGCEAVMISSRGEGMTSLVDLAYQNGAKRFLDKSDLGFCTKLLLLIEEIREEMSNSIFLSHGHAELIKFQLKDFLCGTLGKNVVIFSEQKKKGMTTIVELLEATSERCNKAIILLTKDDEMADGQMRARQNVIHEIGFFQGKYGRRNVILLLEEGVELFTNISGILYIQFNREHFSEIYEQLRNELIED